MIHKKTDSFKNFLNQGLIKGVFTGVSYQVGRLGSGGPLFHFSSHADPVFDLASLTKALVTTPLAHWVLKSYGGLDLPLSELPFAQGGFLHTLKKENVSFFQSHTAGHLLSHTSNLRPWCNLWISCGKSVENAQSRFLHAFPTYQNGEKGRYQYSDIGFVLLGFMLEELTGETLDTLFELFCKKELGHLPSVGFGASFKERALSTGFCNIRKRPLEGEVHDENCFALGGVSGHCGLFGSLSGVVQYLEALMGSNLGALLRETLLNESQRQSYQGRLGWDRGDGTAKDFASGQSFGHLGFTGTSFWLDLSTGHYHILLTNRVVSSRRNPQFREYRVEAARFAESVLEEAFYA